MGFKMYFTKAKIGLRARLRLLSKKDKSVLNTAVLTMDFTQVNPMPNRTQLGFIGITDLGEIYLEATLLKGNNHLKRKVGAAIFKEATDRLTFEIN